VIAPWTRTQNLNFDLGQAPNASPNIAEQVNEVPVDDTIQPPTEDQAESETERFDFANGEVASEQPTEVIAETVDEHQLPEATPSEFASENADDDFDWNEPEEGLSKLKAALAELNAAFGTAANEPTATEEQRLAS
jgi:hypothetical protein